MSVQLALALLLADPASASATLTIEQAVAVSSVAPIRLGKNDGTEGPVVITVRGDSSRAYRLQVQATVADASGGARVVSAAAGALDASGAATTGPSGSDHLRIFGVSSLVRLDGEGRTVLPLRIVYE